MSSDKSEKRSVSFAMRIKYIVEIVIDSHVVYDLKNDMLT